MRFPRAVAAMVAGLLVASVPAGCGVTLSDLPRPGGGVDGPSYEIGAVFADVQSLPEGARVRVDGVDVGRVVDIEAKNFLAEVTMRLPRRLVVAQDATVELRTTTPLGEGFLDLDPGQGAALADGAVLGLDATTTAAVAEDMLTAAALLLSGGGLGQLKSVITELNDALDTDRGDTRKLLRSLTTTLAAFNDRGAAIDRTLDAMDGLSATLADRRATVRDALADAAPAAALLADSTAQFTTLLQRLEGLARASDRVVRRTRADLVATLRDLEPILDALISISDRVDPTLRQLIRFGDFLDGATPGDYLTGDANVSQSSLELPAMSLKRALAEARTPAARSGGTR